jgi:hypothetical protein
VGKIDQLLVNIEGSLVSTEPFDGGAYRIRTCDPHNAIVVLYQLS